MVLRPSFERKPEITLEKLIQIAKSMGLSAVQADGIESANQITKKGSRRENNRERKKDNRNRSDAFVVTDTS